MYLKMLKSTTTTKKGSKRTVSPETIVKFHYYQFQSIPKGLCQKLHKNLQTEIHKNFVYVFE